MRAMWKTILAVPPSVSNCYVRYLRKCFSSCFRFRRRCRNVSASKVLSVVVVVVVVDLVVVVIYISSVE